MNDFSREDLDQLKSQVNLSDLMRSYGIELKPVGRNSHRNLSLARGQGSLVSGESKEAALQLFWL